MQNNFSKTEKKPSGAEPAGAVKALLLLAETVLLLALGLLCTALLIVHGPSERAKARLFARFPLAVFSGKTQRALRAPRIFLPTRLFRAPRIFLPPRPGKTPGRFPKAGTTACCSRRSTAAAMPGSF